MRAPTDVAPSAPRALHRKRWWIVAVIAVLVILIVSLKSIATLYTDDLWFSSVNLHSVWSTLLAVKVGLFASFGGIFFVMLWVNLIVCDRVASGGTSSEPDDELVRRYQRVVRPYAGRIYTGLSIVVALIAAAGTIGQWNNWILFTHGGSFGIKDPQFGMDVGFYVFKLPFLEFLVNWFLISLIVVLAITAVFHYLNGGIRTHRDAPRVRPVVKAHLSVLVALIALVKAAGYILAHYQLVTSTNGYVEGAGYTDVHARIPALWLLFWISLAAAAVLLWNIRRQGWTLPILAIGIWAFVALVVGVIYPAVFQALTVNPNQATLEAPYIQRNITATRAAYQIDDVAKSTFSGRPSLTPTQVLENSATLSNIRLWDPDPQISLPTFQKLQNLAGFYTFQSVSVDRYTVDGKLTPVLVGVRQVNSSNLPSPTWVNTHLQYTHGDGMVLAEANKATANGNPVFAISDVPPVSAKGLPKITQPDVYFGLDQPGYVVADTKQKEFDSQNPAGVHYKGKGGVQLTSFLQRAAFAIREGDLNLLISNQITSDSRIMFVRDVQQMAEKAAPFLSYDSDPYAVLVHGQIDWVLDAYTTTDEYPYSQNANTAQVPVGSGLPSSYNYVRNSVKVVINAYSGSMTFYAMDNDPILRAYESAFPGMFKPYTKMSPALQEHLRYPEDIFSIQAAMYGRYHVTTSSAFFANNGAWNLSPTPGAGGPDQALAVTLTTNAENEVTGGSIQRMAPQYQVLAKPCQTTKTTCQNQQSFTISDAYVPKSGTSSLQTLSAFLIGTYDPGHQGRLSAYVIPTGQSVTGPALAASEIAQNSQVSQDLTLLDQHGSSVLLGNILMVPIDQSILYIRPLYVESTGNPQPQLRYVIAVFGQSVAIESTLDNALSNVLNVPVVSSGQSGSSSTGGIASATEAAIEDYLSQASSLYQQAQTALTNGNLGLYQSDVDSMESDLQAAQQLLTPSTGSSTTPPSSSTSTGSTGSSKKSASSKSKSSSSTSAAKKSTTTTTSSISHA